MIPLNLTPLRMCEVLWHIKHMCLFVSLSFSTGPSSLFSFTQKRGQDNNVKYLKATPGCRKIKTQFPRPWKTIPRTASPSGHSYLLTDAQNQPQTSSAVSLTPQQLLYRSTVRALHHVLCMHCHDDVSGLFSGDFICLAAVQGRACSLRYLWLPAQVSIGTQAGVFLLCASVNTFILL